MRARVERMNSYTMVVFNGRGLSAHLPLALRRRGGDCVNYNNCCVHM